MGESAKQLLGGFRLEEIVGLGAQGRVWRAVCEDASLGFVRKGDQVALKIKEIATGKSMRSPIIERFHTVPQT